MYVDGAQSWRQGSVANDVPFSVLDGFCRAVLLTPECDLQQQKAATAAFIALFEAPNVVLGLVADEWTTIGAVSGAPTSRGRRREIDDRIRRLQRHQFPRYHWLDAPPGTDSPLVADFQFLTCVPLEFLDELTPLAALDDPFRAELAARYASYMGRIGTPDGNEAASETWRSQFLDAHFPLAR